VNPDSTNEKIERKALEQVADKNLILYICLNPQMDRPGDVKQKWTR